MKHPFYILDASTLSIAGIDLISSAQLVIDTVDKCVWSHRLARPNAFTTPAASHPTVQLPCTVDTSLPDMAESPCTLAHCDPHVTSGVLEHQFIDAGSCSEQAVSPATAVKQLGFDVPQQVNANLPDHLTDLYESTVRDADLPFPVAEALKAVLIVQQHTFAKDSLDLGYCDILEHDVDTADAHPIKQSPRRPPPLRAIDAEDEILDDMLATGVIEPSVSPWASPVTMVKKKDGTFRFCIDYRRVNAVTKKDAFPVPDIHDAFDSLRGARYFCTLDLFSGYWQVGLTERAKERSAFCTRRGLFHFTRLPFGMTGAPSTFCRLMSCVLTDLQWKICLAYLDDVIIYASTHEELIDRLRIVLERLHSVGLKVKPSKCCLMRDYIPFLGHMVTANGIEPQPDKLQALRDWATPRCLKEVRAFYGLASYYRRYVREFATLAETLTRLTKKGCKFYWDEETQNSFDAIKNALCNAVTLAYPVPDRPVYLDTNASDVAVGGVISQVIDGRERPIAFFSRVMNPAQRNYCATRRELLAVVTALQHFRHYLLGTNVILRTDHHSLKWLKTFKRPEGILARWLETLAEYSYVLEHRPGRLHSNADGVSLPFCKQCWDRPAKEPWIDEFHRADELTEPLSMHLITLCPEISTEEIIEHQQGDTALQPIRELLQTPEAPSMDTLRALPLDSRNLWSQRPAVQLQSNVLLRVATRGPCCVASQIIRLCTCRTACSPLRCGQNSHTTTTSILLARDETRLCTLVC